ncbi:phage holin family protein [Akkermansiaceae bacterium]|nr:phage holin family protein [Akkermansiaceae bacterium]
MPFRSSENSDSPGLKDEVTSLAKSASDYLAIRSELVAIEAKEAGIILKKRIISLLVAAVGIFVAYILLLGALIYFLGEFLRNQLSNSPLGGWPGSLLLMGALHLIIGVIFLLKARKRPNTPLFDFTKSEWKKDQQWLSQKTKTEN